MHDELRRFGLRRTRVWTLVLIVVGTFAGSALACLAMLDPDWPPDEAGVTGGWTTVGVGAAAGLVGTVLLVLFGHYSGARRAWPTVPLIPAPDLVPIAEGLALARGEPVPRVWRLDSATPNVACLPRPHGRHLIVSTATEAGLTRDELEAVMSLQFSLLLDEGAGRVRRSLTAAGLMITWVLRLSVVALAVVLVRRPVWAGLTINLAIWYPMLLIVLVVWCQRRLRWSWGMVGDAVAVETTRHPEPLASALRRLAGHNEGVVPVRQTWGAADPWWALTVRANIEIATMVVNGRAKTRSSTEQVSDAALLLRARIVEQVCLRHEAATVASWREAEAVFARLARASGDGSSTDGTIDGVTVTTTGALGTLPPVNGPWPATYRDEAARERLRSARPIRPDAAALAAYDEAMASGLRPF
jgi:Zn-dependent protease with chaperone function